VTTVLFIKIVDSLFIIDITRAFANIGLAEVLRNVKFVDLFFKSGLQRCSSSPSLHVVSLTVLVFLTSSSTVEVCCTGFGAVSIELSSENVEQILLESDEGPRQTSFGRTQDDLKTVLHCRRVTLRRGQHATEKF